MPLNFSGPTSHPISLGDSYSLYKRSIIPTVPVVDNIILEEGEVPEKDLATEPAVDKIDKIEDGGQEDGTGEEEELNVKRKTSPTEEISSSGEGNKKLKEENSVDQSAGQGSDLVEKSGSSTGGEVAAVSSDGDGNEPKVGDTSSSLPAEPERDHAEQKTEQKSDGGEL